MLKIFTFEENMKLGRRAYADVDFTKAQDYFEGAQLIFPSDFRASFWLARTLVMCGQYVPALKRLHECRSLRPDLGEALINEWISIAMKEEISNLSRVNKMTDETLDSLSLRKNIRLIDIFKFVGLFFLIGTIVDIAVINLFHVKLTTAWRHITRSVAGGLFVAALFYKKTVLPENFFGAMRVRKERLREFQGSKYFYWWMWGIVLEVFLVIGASLLHFFDDLNYIKKLQQNNYGILEMYITLIVGTVIYRIILQGGVFTYLKRFNRVAAYILTTLLQTITGTNLIRVLFAITYIYIYEKIESLSIVIILSIVEGAIVVTVLYILTFFIELNGAI